MTSVYDQLNGYDRDYDYWRELARAVAPQDLCDLGCGTGMLTVLFAADGYRVTGVDPDAEMLAVARSRPGHETVRWVEGVATHVADQSADMVTMTSHVSQVFLTDQAWHEVLTDVGRILRPGGVLSFDMRNPLARGWQGWNPTDSRRSVTTPHGPADVWHEVTEVRGSLVRFDTTTEFVTNRGREVVSNTLCFRDEPTLRETLTDAGFEVTCVHGDWDGSPATRESRELIVSARRCS